MAVSSVNRRLVKERAGMRCEYCRIAEAWEPFFPFHVEHIRARQHKGTDTPDNLAFACNHCNLFKGPNLTSIDPDTGLLTPLFNPRIQLWSCRDDTGSTLGSSQQVALSRPYRTYLQVGFTQGGALLALGYLILPLQGQRAAGPTTHTQ
jgi:hypothetical protein